MAATGTTRCACRHILRRMGQSTTLSQRSRSRKYCTQTEAVKSNLLEPQEQMPSRSMFEKSSSSLELDVTGTEFDRRMFNDALISSGIRTPQQPDLAVGKPVTVDARRVDPTTVKQVYYFDSLSFVKVLETRGFSRDQAEGLVEALTEIVNTTLDHQSRHMITKKQQEITVQQLMAEIVSVKKDMVLLQKSEFSQLRSETEKMSIELNNVKKSLVDEVNKLKGHVTLDINLERGRSIEAHATNSTKLQELNNKIDTDIANLKTVYEQYRNDVLKFAAGTVLTCATLCMGIIRLWN